MSQFNDKYETTAHNGTAAAAATLVEGYDPDEDRTFQFVQITKGRLDEAKTPEGETVEVLEFDDGFDEKMTIGSPDVIKPLIAALEELQEKVDAEG